MKKKILGILAGIFVLAAACIPVSAEVATDYTYDESEMLDFCVFNIWGADTGIAPNVATINKITMTINVSDFAGEPVDVKLYSREQVTWTTWSTPAQTISGDGTYTFELDMGENAFAADQLATIYVKDIRCCVAPDEDPDGQELEASGVACHVTLDSVKFNASGEDTTSADENTAVTSAQTKAAQTAADTSDTSSASDYIPFIAAAAAIVVICIIVVIVIISKKKN